MNENEGMDCEYCGQPTDILEEKEGQIKSECKKCFKTYRYKK